jgi:uncharacterized protein (TIGR03546 family)
MIKAIAKALIALNTNVRKEQIAAGFAWGILLALVPVGNILWFALFILTFFFKINSGMQLFTIVIVKLFRLALIPAIDAVGWALLNIGELRPTYTMLYNLPIAPLTRFNNTLVAGGLVIGIILWLPLFFAMRAFVVVYRAKIAPKIAESKVYKAFIKLPLVKKLQNAISSAMELSEALD